MKRILFVLLTLVFIYPMISRGAEKDSISVKLVWEKEFSSPVKDFSITEEKGVPTLQTIITKNEVIFGEGKNAKRINASGFMSPNGEYVGVPRVSYGDKDNVLPGSKYYIYDKKGNLILERNVKDNYQPGVNILNNGAFIVGPGGMGTVKLILEQLDGTQKTIFDCRKCDMLPSGAIDFSKKSNLFVINFSGIGVILYDSKGNKLWKRELEPGWTGSVAISPYGKYIAAIGKGVRWLYEFDKKGNLLWKLRTSVVDVMKYSEDEEHFIVCGPPNTIKFILSKTGNVKWEYKLPEGRDYYAVDISSNNNYVIGIDGGGGREVPSGNINTVYLYDNKGNLLWQKSYEGINWKMPKVSFSQDSKYFIMAIGKKIYCYEIGRKR